jgi:phosphatidate cytidylyltransferase
MLRVASALVLIVVVLAIVWLLPAWATLSAAVAVAGAAGIELARLAARAGAGVPAAFVGLGAAGLALALVADGGGVAGAGTGLLGVALFALVVAAGTVSLTLGPPAPATLTRAAVMCMAPAYVGLPLGAIAWVHGVAGPPATTWLLTTVAVSDSAQYYSGRWLGRTKLAPIISPAKTVEGAAGGLIAAAITGFVLGPMWMSGLSPAAAAATGAALALFGMAGDLFESLLKRSAAVKDSSNLIPGHGGVLDRIDSYLFAAPAFYVFVRYFR